MHKKVKEKLRAIGLREKGYSLNEIIKKVRVAKSSVSVWVRNISLTDKARDRLLTKIKLGQLISAENKRRKTQEIINGYRKKAIAEISGKKLDKTHKKIICSLLYWCEGLKSNGGVRFINSNPLLIKTFLNLFRKSFKIDEKKFRVGLHLHKYHNENKQKKYWAGITNIPKVQFIKVYWKSNSGKRIRKDYPGCATIYYHDNKIAKELIAITDIFAKFY